MGAIDGREASNTHKAHAVLSWVSAIMGLQFPTMYEKEARKTGELYLGRSELRVSDQKLTYERDGTGLSRWLSG